MEWKENSLDDIIKEVKRLNREVETLRSLVNRTIINQNLFNTTHLHQFTNTPATPIPTVVAETTAILSDISVLNTEITSNYNDIIKIENRQKRLRLLYEQKILEIKKNIEIINSTDKIISDGNGNSSTP